MGTKNNPSKFDCYKRALDDEPMFILLARDLLAPALIRLWASNRAQEITNGQRPETDRAAVDEAMECAAAMGPWRAAHDGEWRKPVPVPQEIAHSAPHTNAMGGAIVDAAFDKLPKAPIHGQKASQAWVIYQKKCLGWSMGFALGSIVDASHDFDTIRKAFDEAWAIAVAQNRKGKH